MKSMDPSPFEILFICLMALSVVSCQKEASQKEAKKPNCVANVSVIPTNDTINKTGM